MIADQVSGSRASLYSKTPLCLRLNISLQSLILDFQVGRLGIGN